MVMHWNPNHDYRQGPEYIEVIDAEARAALRWMSAKLIQIWEASAPENPASWRDVFTLDRTQHH